MRRATIFAALCALTTSTVAIASIHMSKLEHQRTFESHEACLTELHASYAAHRALVSPHKVKEDGSTQEITHVSETQGVQVINPTHARYIGTIYWHYGSSRVAPNGQREVSHRWDEDDLYCEGAMLTSRGASGWTQSTFEPLLGSDFKLPKIRKKRGGRPRL
jgi:hypothetical protein